MVPILTVGVMWCCSALFASIVGINYSGIKVLDKLDAHKRYLNQQENLRQSAKLERIRLKRIAELPTPGLLVGGELPKWILDWREWAIREVSSLSLKDLQVLRSSARYAKAGELEGIEMRFTSSGKAYSFDKWQALCAFADSSEVRDLLNEKLYKPVEVDPFDDPRRE